MTARPEAHLEHVDYARRDLPIHTVTSADGTRIAYEKSGTGPAVVIVGGGLNEKAMHAELAERLSRRFTVYNYDRRARGDSDDRLRGDYCVDREIEDLAAVITAAGPHCNVFANCTGSMIAVPAAARGIPMGRLALYEPPYGGPKVPPGYLTDLQTLLAQDRRTEAVALFLKWDALFTDAEIEFFKTHPIWPAFEAMARSMPYDSMLSDDAGAVPTAELARIPVPTLVLAGDESPEWMLDTCRGIAEGIPEGRFARMPSAGHLMDDVAGADLLAAFYAEAPAQQHRPPGAPSRPRRRLARLLRKALRR